MKAIQTIAGIVISMVVSVASAADLSFSQIVGWGENLNGQATGIAGASPTNWITSSTGAVRVAGLNLSFVNVSAGNAHALALLNDSTVLGWGWNRFGQCTGANLQNSEDGNGLVSIGDKVLRDVIATSSGFCFSLALKRDGTVVGFGDASSGKTIVPPGLSNVIAISAGWTHSLALKQDGTVVGWGVPPVPPGISNIAAIAAGRGTYAPNLALKRDGTIIQWSPAGSLEPAPDSASNVTTIAVGDGQCLAIKRGGQVIEWHLGDKTVTEVPGLSNAVQVAAAGEDLSLALRSDGTVAAWGGLRRPATVPVGLSNVVAIAAGDGFCLAITTNPAVAPRFLLKKP